MTLLPTDLPEAFYQFVADHAGDDFLRLRLKRWTDVSFDTSFAIDQIEARQKTRGKLPTWQSHPTLLFPATICAEQASSEESAAYKASLIGGGSLCDLTGGLGVDSYHFSRVTSRSVYVERFDHYCNVARHNFKVLQVPIEVVCDDAVQFLENTDTVFDTLYIDPARRGTSNKRLFSLAECEPNVVELMPLLCQKGRRILIKVSPMADIAHTLALLPQCVAVHVVSVRNECKELLLVVDSVATAPHEVEIVCVDLGYADARTPFAFTLAAEQTTPMPAFASAVREYLYEPDTSVLKAGAFKLVAERFGAKKLAANSHLYTAQEAITDFPGRRFKVLEVIPFSAKSAKKLSAAYPRANVTVRNFPLTVDAFRKKCKIADGGDIYLFCTTLHPQLRVVIACKKI